MKPVKNKKLPKSIPLLCWDVFLMQDHSLNTRPAEDVQRLRMLAEHNEWRHDLDFEKKMIRENKTVLVTDPDQLIVYVSSNIRHMTGYRPEEVLGKSPKIFQGAETNPEARAKIRTAISQRQAFTASITNYRKDRIPYHCYLEGFPLFNQSGELVNFIAFEAVLL